MNQQEFLAKLSAILDEARTGVLTTVDSEGRPHGRWMTPALLKGRGGALYCVTSPRSDKAADLAANPAAEWLIQTPTLNEIAIVRGPVNVIDNPALRTELLDMIGRRLTVFWKVNPAAMDLVVLETVMREGEYFRPMAGSVVRVSFAAEA